MNVLPLYVSHLQEDNLNAQASRYILKPSQPTTQQLGGLANSINSDDELPLNANWV